MKAQQLTSGFIAGLAGAFVFGMMMLMMGMLAMVGKLIGTDSTMLAFAFHMLNGGIIGLIFALLLGSSIKKNGKSVLLGTVYGVVWWFLGPLLLMPIMMGMGPQLHSAGMTAAMPSLIGHVIFGAILGFTYGKLQKGK